MALLALTLLATACALFSASSAPAADAATAADTPAVERMQVSLWPEYDRPDVLVMLNGELAPQVPLPASLSLPIPAGLKPHAVAWRDASGLKVADYTLEARGGHTLVSMKLPARAFHLEYYAPLVRTSGRRGYSFEWPGLVALADLTYEVEVPSGAGDFVVKPAATSSRVGTDGLSYRMGDLGPVAKGQRVRIEISYQKDTDTLSAPPFASPPAPSTQLPSASTTPSATPPAATTAPDSGAGHFFDNTPLWPAYVAAALLIGILIGVGLGRRGR